MLTPAFILAERCPYCSKFRSPRDIIAMPGGAKICTSCEQRHLEALEALSTGQFTGECAECGRSAEQIHSPTGQMAIHFEAGRYKAMCLKCDATYTPKRRDLYDGTQFAHDLKLN